LRVLAVNPTEPRDDRVAVAAGVLAEGGVVALPTETFYGLAVDPFDTDALARLNRLKRKPEGSPFLLLVEGPAQVERIAARLPDLYLGVVERFWPGPLTVVLPAAEGVPSEVSGGRGTVAVRTPGLSLPRRLAGRLGRPITGVSANIFGEPPCRTATDVAVCFGEEIELILDGGPTPGGAPSTILDLSGPRPRVLREGLVPRTALEPHLPGLDKASV
jgi:L-threonylcarbamoyladenylate synthase